MELLFVTFAALISVINPFGTLPIFIGLTKDKEARDMNEIAVRTVINVLVIMLITLYGGEYILAFFGIGLTSLKLTGGLVIASSGFALLSGNFSRHKGMKRKEKEDARKRSDISMTPLAIPMLSGPGSMSLLITYKEMYPSLNDQLVILGAIIVTCAITLLIMLSGRVIVRSLGASGINALSRIIGFIVISIGIEYIVSTIIEIIKTAQ
ncbi:MarC family protein [Crocinitomicaceae bacterium]|nr:MarC family protein [Crocinitomicaceae bacterium]